ncbi:MAG: cyclic nucleotide-binding domain-containing protein [Archangiaceae bacterium]|nr:cyclic nucleotide-binding domain-containing protein [Archangiaceae bacterium]
MAGVSNPKDALEFLPTIALFGGLQEPTLDRIISMLHELRMEPGQEICRQGDVGRSMFLVRHGEVVVTRLTPSGRRIRMVRMGPGEFFGEMTLIDVQKRSATVQAEKPTTLWSLGNMELYKLYQEDVPGYVMVLQNICRELSRRLRTTNSRLSEMAAESDDESTQIRSAVTRRNTKPG